MNVTIKNRLPSLLRERGIRSATAFGRRLKEEQDFVLSPSQLSRYVREIPPAFDLVFVNATCNVLQCLPNDLYTIEVTLAYDEPLDPVLAFPVNAVILRMTAEGAVKENGVTRPPVVRADKKVPSTRMRIKAKTSRVTGPSDPIFPFTNKGK